MLIVNNLIGFGAGAASPLVKSVSFRTHAEDISNAATYTFSSQDIGTAASDRYVVVSVHGSANATTSVSGVTIDFGGGDTAMTLVTDGTNTATQSNNQTDCALFILNVTSGTTATIKPTFGGTKNRAAIGVWAVYGLTGTTANHVQKSTANPLTATLNTLASGIAIVAGGIRVSSSFTATAGYTEDFDSAVEAAATHTGGSNGATSAGTLAITMTQASSTEPCGVFASW